MNAFQVLFSEIRHRPWVAHRAVIFVQALTKNEALQYRFTSTSTIFKINGGISSEDPKLIC